MNPQSVPQGLLISRDLFFTSKVTGTAQQLGCAIQVVPNTATAATRIAAGGIRCLFVDLSPPPAGLAELIGGLPKETRPKVIAFGSHVATAQLQAARDAGCDDVLPRSRFSGELPALLRQYLLEAGNA